MNDFYNVFSEIFTANSLGEYVFPDISKQFEMLLEMLISANKKMNLTAISDDESVIFKHFADCALLARYIPENAKMLDIGTGAGFPAFPIAILRPDVEILAIDSTDKKIRYVRETAEELCLDNLETMSIRAEDLAKNKKYFQKFDFVTSRAVADLPILCELCIPFVNLGGTFAAMKAASAKDELARAKNAYIKLGCALRSDEQKHLTYKDQTLERHILLFEKERPTPPIYPRSFSQISKKPIQ